MAVKNTAQVVIGGKIITLGGYESEEYFQKIGQRLSSRRRKTPEVSYPG